MTLLLIPRRRRRGSMIREGEGIEDVKESTAVGVDWNVPTEGNGCHDLTIYLVYHRIFVFPVFRSLLHVHDRRQYTSTLVLACPTCDLAIMTLECDQIGASACPGTPEPQFLPPQKRPIQATLRKSSFSYLAVQLRHGEGVAIKTGSRSVS